MLANKSMSKLKQLTVDEFKAVINSEDWDHEYDSETTSITPDYHNIPSFSHLRNDYVEYNAGKTSSLEGHNGNLSMNSTLDDYGVFYQRGFTYVEHLPETFALSNESANDWSFDGFMVVNDDNKPISIDDLVQFIPSSFSDISINVKDFMNCEHYLTYLDSDKVADAITLEGSFSKDIAFSGKLIAKAESNPKQSSGTSWSGKMGQWFVLKLYRTTNGHYVCHREKKTLWDVCKDISEWVIAKNHDEVVAFFGQGWLAHDIYKTVGIENVVHIE